MRRREEFQTAEESFSHPGSGPAELGRSDSERCRCNRRVEITIQYRDRSIGLCGRCFDRSVAAAKRGAGRGA